MLSLFLSILACSLVATSGMLWVLLRAAPRLGLVDHPSGRKQHHRRTPVIGGLAIIAGVAVVAMGCALHVLGLDRTLEILSGRMGFVIGAIALTAVGALDDYRPVPPRYKLLVQLICCVLAVFLDGNVVGDIGVTVGAFQLSLGPLAAPFTVLVMLTVANAMNMIDGVDGLAGGITFAAFALMAKGVIAAGYTADVILMGTLLGAVGAFLMINFPLLPNRRSKTFLGDAGSLLCGFLLAYLAINLSAMPQRVFKPSTALFFFFIPVADTIWLYLRRVWYAQAPFAAGRDHIHHLLMRRLSPHATSWTLVGASAALAAAAYLAERLGVMNWVLVFAWIALFFLYGLATHKAWRVAWTDSRAQADTVTAQEHSAPGRSLKFGPGP
jgi:UDP-GlcNAc:undecaprenyl-phosphate/decaprenyl-phosphate GlcNAc-1-phosphate transferase